jgi:hypothetical protein
MEPQDSLPCSQELSPVPALLSFWLSLQCPICIPFFPIRAIFPAHLILFNLTILITFREGYYLRSSSLHSFGLHFSNNMITGFLIIQDLEMSFTPFSSVPLFSWILLQHLELTFYNNCPMACYQQYRKFGKCFKFKHFPCFTFLFTECFSSLSYTKIDTAW